MTKLTESQLAEIAERNHSLFIRLHDVPETLVLPSTAGQFVTDIDALLAHIAAVTAERDEANQRRAETVAMCDMLTAEREAIAKYIGYEWSPGSHYDLPEGVKDFVAGEVQSALVESQQRISRLLDDGLLLSQQLAAANQRAEDAARVEREAVVAWLKQQAREFDAALETAQMTPNAYAALHTERAVLIIAADAISRNEHNQDAAPRQE